jgi:hypothetical protein
MCFRKVLLPTGEYEPKLWPDAIAVATRLNDRRLPRRAEKPTWGVGEYPTQGGDRNRPEEGDRVDENGLPWVDVSLESRRTECVIIDQR